MEHNNPDAVPAGKRVAVSSQNLTDGDINTTCQDPGGMDFQASPTIDQMRIKLPDNR